MTGSRENSHRENSNGEPTERSNLIGSQEPTNRTGHRHKHSFWIRWPSQAAHLTWAVVAREYANALLVFVPLGIASGLLQWDAAAVFTLNFFAIIPLASLLSFATEELAAVMGQALGGLMNATFGNAVELIVRLTTLTSVKCIKRP